MKKDKLVAFFYKPEGENESEYFHNNRSDDWRMIIENRQFASTPDIKSHNKAIFSAKPVIFDLNFD